MCEAKVIGLLTLENVLEKILQADIHDERDRENMAGARAGHTRAATFLYDQPRTLSKFDGRALSYMNSQVGGLGTSLAAGTGIKQSNFVTSFADNLERLVKEGL
mgnify:CR=1 FL=1